MQIEISYESPEAQVFYENLMPKHNPRNTGFDLCLVENVDLEGVGFVLASLGVILKAPEGYYFELVPRSSTFAKYHVMQANGVGVIDQDYCGYKDVIKIPLFNPVKQPIFIPAGTRIAQAILRKLEPITSVVRFYPSGSNRGGFGSTGE